VPPDADPLLLGRYRGADVLVTVSTAEGPLLSSKEYADVSSSTVPLDEPVHSLSVDPLRTRLFLYVWDVDPLKSTLLGSLELKPGEWPSGRVTLATDGPVSLVVRLDWTAEPTVHRLPVLFW
jgi:hypothetical protein